MHADRHLQDQIAERHGGREQDCDRFALSNLHSIDRE
jgi:hypothetical protein